MCVLKDKSPRMSLFLRPVLTAAHFFTWGIVICMRRTSRRSLVNRLSSGNRKVSWQDSTAVSQTTRGVKRNPRCDKVVSGGLIKPLTPFEAVFFFDKFQKQTLTWTHTVR